MPCWEVNLISVEFKAKNIEHLKKALDNLGYRYRVVGDTVVVERLGVIRLTQGRVDIERSDQGKLNALKREYSKVTIEQVAKAKRWSVRPKGQYKFQLAKY